MVVAFSRLACGPPGCVHGGCLFTMLDTAMTQALTVTEENMCLTKSMAVDYKTFVKAPPRPQTRMPHAGIPPPRRYLADGTRGN